MQSEKPKVPEAQNSNEEVKVPLLTNGNIPRKCSRNHRKNYDG
jgi:hypothetical protein